MLSSPGCNARREEMAARAQDSAAAPVAERELTIRRTFDAPRGLVFRAWTEPQHLAQWSCPRGFTMIENRGELRVGGAFFAWMRSPQGEDHRMRGVYREVRKWLLVSPPSRYVGRHGEHFGTRPGGAEPRPHQPRSPLRRQVLHRRDLDRHLLPADLSLALRQALQRALLRHPRGRRGG